MTLFPEFNTDQIAHAIINKLAKGDVSDTISVDEIREALKKTHIVVETKRNGFGEIIGYGYTIRENEKTIHS